MKERLQKVLARWGVASRRACEQLIRSGRVTVNGTLIREVGFKADPEYDKIQVDGKVLRDVPPRQIVIALNKPEGYLSTCKSKNPEEKKVLDLVPLDMRLFPVGRLDRESSGLLLLTNDGELANRIMHPRFGFDKEYFVRVKKPLQPSQLETLATGIILDGRKAKPISLQPKGRRSFNIIMGEGRKREIRNMVKAVGAEVLELRRIRIGPLPLKKIPVGHWRELSAREIEQLLSYSR